MITELSVNSTSSNSQLDAAIESLIAELTRDTSNQKVAKDLEDKIHELKDLLIEYILANSTEDKKEIGKQISQVYKSIETETNNVNTVKNGLKAIGNDPSSWNANTLATLESYKSLLTETGS